MGVAVPELLADPENEVDAKTVDSDALGRRYGRLAMEEEGEAPRLGRTMEVSDSSYWGALKGPPSEDGGFMWPPAGRSGAV